MNKISFLKVVLPASLAVALFTINVAHAEKPERNHHSYHNNKESYTSETKQTVTDNGVVRSTKTTNAAGETATRNTTVTNDKANSSHTRTVTGTNFKGEAYSDKSVVHKTDNGYTSEEQHVGADGKTVKHSVNAVIDESTGTVTKTISTTPDGGETTTRTVVKKIHKHE